MICGTYINICDAYLVVSASLILFLQLTLWSPDIKTVKYGATSQKLDNVAQV